MNWKKFILRTLFIIGDLCLVAGIHFLFILPYYDHPLSLPVLVGTIGFVRTSGIIAKEFIK